MASPLQRLYQTKLVLLATVSTVAGIALLLLAHWAEHLTGAAWLQDLPVTDIGSALFTTGLLAIFFQYIGDQDAEEHALRRMRTVLASEAPAMRDAVIQGFAFQPDDLAKISSTDTLDRIARNSLGIQLGDQALATDVYADLRDQVIHAPERRYDAHVSVALAPWPNGPATGRGSMFVATVRWEYTVTPASPTMRFAAVSDLTEYRELLRDPAVSGVWYVEPIGGMDGGSQTAFELAQFSVAGKALPIRRTARAGAQTYTVTLSRQHMTTKPVKLSYTYKVLVQRHGHLLHLDISRPTKGLTIDFWYGGAGIRYVNVLDYIASSRPTTVLRSPENAPNPNVSVSFDGWVFPKSGVAFVWVLEEEVRKQAVTKVV